MSGSVILRTNSTRSEIRRGIASIRKQDGNIDPRKNPFLRANRFDEQIRRDFRALVNGEERDMEAIESALLRVIKEHLPNHPLPAEHWVLIGIGLLREQEWVAENMDIFLSYIHEFGTFYSIGPNGLQRQTGSELTYNAGIAVVNKGTNEVGMVVPYSSEGRTIAIEILSDRAACAIDCATQAIERITSTYHITRSMRHESITEMARIIGHLIHEAEELWPIETALELPIQRVKLRSIRLQREGLELLDGIVARTDNLGNNQMHFISKIRAHNHSINDCKGLDS